jgi:hypothetical protein
MSESESEFESPEHVISELCQEYIQTDISVEDLIPRIKINNENININMIKNILNSITEYKGKNIKIKIGWSYSVKIFDPNHQNNLNPNIYDYDYDYDFLDSNYQNRLNYLIKLAYKNTINTPIDEITYSINIKEKNDINIIPYEYNGKVCNVYSIELTTKWMCPAFFGNYNCVVNDIEFRIRYTFISNPISINSNKIYIINKDID